MESPRLLGVLGLPPRPAAHTVRVRKLADFERLVAPPGPGGAFPAGHAVAHGVMVGQQPVAFRACAADTAAAWVAALAALLSDDTVACVVAPGATALDTQRALAAAFEGWRGARSDVALWLDPPDDDPAAAVARRQALGPPSRGVRLALPSVRSITPGLGRASRLPASCVVGPLALGLARHLPGLHEVERRYGPRELAALREAGCGALVARGPRRLVSLAFPPPLPRPASTTPLGAAPAADPIERAVREATEHLIEGRRDGPALWRALEREATRIMEGLVARGVVSAYAARSDAETWEAAGGHPCVEVVYRTPRRVRQVKILTRPSGQ